MTDPRLSLAVTDAAGFALDKVFAMYDTSPEGLVQSVAEKRRLVHGPNALVTHRVSWPRIFARQLANPILILLLVTAVTSMVMGDVANALVITIILVMSVGLGFLNEYRAENAAADLHDNITHRVSVMRHGVANDVDVVKLVPGDVIQLGLGSIVPADARLISSEALMMDESILTGESLPVSKSTEAATSTELGDLDSVVFMGTVVAQGSCTAVVVATGTNTVLGSIARGLGRRPPQTEFQRGLRRFSVFLLIVASALMAVIFAANLVLQRPLLESLLFSLAIAIGMTPQLLPAVVSTGLAVGSKRLRSKRVLAKRLAAIEDLGDMDVLVTDKTGTLTEGRIDFVRAIDVSGASTVLYGLLASEVDYVTGLTSTTGMSSLDAALWSSGAARDTNPARFTRRDVIPFDHTTRMTVAVVESTAAGDQLLVAKGAPESILRVCAEVSDATRAQLEQLFADGSRVVAVASRVLPAHSVSAGRVTIDPPALERADVRGLTLAGFLVFRDPPRESARASLEKLDALGVEVKIATGDNAAVAQKVCLDLGVEVRGVLTGEQIDATPDDELAPMVESATIFARVSPEQKARILRLLRKDGRAVGFLGDGVNDALALHDADVGISVDTATDVAKDAADIVLLEKDLGVLADGIAEGRRIFANTMKYILMGTSGDFGNMFSAAIGSVVLNFLPMLPGQILLNDLLYDSSQLAIPTDRVDPEQVRRPAHWNIGLVRRFMFTFGPISSLFDFATFALMLFVFHASQSEFQTGWFVESLATETLIVFAVRTRRVPFLRSRASWGLTLTVLAVVAIGCALPYSPLNGLLGFTPLPPLFFVALVAMVILYLLIVESAKHQFFRRYTPAPSTRHRGHDHRIGRRTVRYSVSGARG